MAIDLLPGEALVLHRHRHWVLLARALVWPLVMVVLVAVLDVPLRHRLLGHDVKVALTLFGLAVAGAWLIVAWIRWVSSSITLTDRRVVLESGVLSRTSKVIALDRVQDISTRQGLGGRLLGYGTILIDSAGARGAEELQYTPSPRTIRDRVFVLAEAERRRGPEPSSAPGDL